ncbi:hypothetical protein [Burkholderia sp. WAC0059]|uniref:hypothetical protein n=1 Tax=Burkholderia sp. WAC0059 TaxID=2066022 RepID=UPI0011AEEFF0|nr:hypothetical protein [Burkholderia sp. WAC0059]
MSIIASIRTALLARKGNWRKICDETNLSYWWLTKFAQGRISNPGTVNLEILRTYLEKEGGILWQGEEPDEQ